MGKGAKAHPNRVRLIRQAACVACTVVLVIVIVILAALYFSLFKPRDPKVQVPTMQLLSLYSAGYPSAVSSVNLTLVLQVTIYNPNRAHFIIQDGSTACLYYHGSQAGFTEIPTGSIPAKAFSTISVPLTVQGLTALQGPYLSADVVTGVFPVSTSVTIFGRVTTLNIFTHHSDVISKCDVNVSLNARGIESYTCLRSYSLDG